MNETQKYLCNGGTLASLKEEFSIESCNHATMPLVILNYTQCESPKTNPIVKECRGLVLEVGTWDIVSCGFKRFFNLGENLEEQKNFNWNNFTAIEKIDGCLQYDQSVNLYGGGTLKIGKVVNQKLKPTLVGMNEDGEIVPCEVINWSKNGKKDNWIDIEIDCQVSQGVGCGRADSNKIRLTTNHSIFVNGEYTPASEAKVGDVMIGHEYVPSSSVIHLIKSSLLGDGCVCFGSGAGAKFTDCHKEDHRGYLDKIKYWLGSCGIKERYRISGYGTKMVDISTMIYHGSLIKIRQEWYPNGLRILPNDLSWIDDFSVAKWYMDDGSLVHSEKQLDRAAFSTYRFSEKGVDALCEKLNCMYGVNTVKQLDKVHNKFFIRINNGYKNEIDNFWAKIAPHIIECMRYKLPVKFRDVEYTEYPEGKEDIVKTTVNITKISNVENNKRNFPSGRVGFDIQTTTGNYFSKGVLVHNSLIQLFCYKKNWMVKTRGTFADGVCGDSGKPWSELIWGCLQKYAPPDLKFPSNINWLNENKTYVFEMVGPWNKNVTPHPETKLYLLAEFNNLEHKEAEHGCLGMVAGWIGCESPKEYILSSREEVVSFVNNSHATYEGVVLRDDNGMMIKVKNDKWLALFYLKNNGNGFSNKALLPFLLDDKESPDELLTYYPEVKEKYESLKSKITILYCGMMYVWHGANHNGTQKDFALSINGKTPFVGILYQARQKKVCPSIIWKQSADLILKVLESK